MKPGIYHNISHSDYFAIPAISNSRLGRLLDCPAAVNIPVEDTPAMAIGRATHCLILEHDCFDERYILGPKFDKRTKAGKEAFETFTASLNGREPIDQDDFDRLWAMRNSIMAHPSASGLISTGQAEVTIIWTDEITGLLCKARIDWIPANIERTLMDLKTTKDAEAHPFTQSCIYYGYARQAAFYLDGMQTLGQPYDLFGFVAVEQEAPHRCEVFTLEQAFIDFGRQQYRDLMTIELACRESGQWPAYKNPGVTELALPSYLRKESVLR